MFKKLLVLAIVVSQLMFLNTALAVDGRVYFGKYFNQTLRATPSGGNAEYVAGIEVGHCFFDRVRAYTSVETLMDERVSDRTYHPASVAYTGGVTIRLYADWLYLRGEHQCWHPVDAYGDVEQYDLIQVEYRFGQKRSN